MELIESLGIRYEKTVREFIVKIKDKRCIVIYVEDSNGGGVEEVFEVDENNKIINNLDYSFWEDISDDLTEIVTDSFY